jgi:hypothetical protein
MQVSRDDQLEREFVGRISQSHAGTDFDIPRFSGVINDAE